MRVSWKLCSHSATSHPHVPPFAKHPVLLSMKGQERQRVMGSILNTTSQLGLHESREEKRRKRGGWRGKYRKAKSERRSLSNGGVRQGAYLRKPATKEGEKKDRK